MRITKIEQQKKDKSRYNIYLDGEFAFGLYDDSLLKYGLRSGDELNDIKLKEIRDEDEFIYGKKAAYSYLSYKQRSRKEIEKKLLGKKVSQYTIDKVLSWLRELNYLNDEAYAKMIIEDKLRKKPMGRRMIEQKLKMSGIDKETIEKTLAENLSEETELIKAKELLEKYSKKSKFKNEYDKKNKCYKYLISRGFDGQMAQMVLKEER